MTNKPIDARALAERLGVTYATVLTWGRRGIIPRIRPLNSRRFLFDVDAVLKALAAIGRQEVARA